MDGTATSRFFLEPKQTFHRQYEALRAVFVEGQPLDRVAVRFGYKLSALQIDGQPLSGRSSPGCHAPLFLPDGRGRPPGRCRAEAAPPRTARSRRLPGAEPHARPHAPLTRRGLFLFLPLLARLGFDRLVAEAGYPGSEMVPAPSRLALAPGAEAARQGTPQSHRRLQLRRGPRPVRRPQRPPQEVIRDRLLLPGRPRPAAGAVAGMGQGPGPGDVPRGRGVLARLPPDPLPRRPRGARPPLFAAPRQGRDRACSPSSPWSRTGRCLCYANANLTRADQHGELMRFVEFWHEVAGSDPRWLYFDSKVVDYPELSRVNQRKIHFVTIRRRGAAILRRLERQPAVRLEGGRDRHPEAMSSAHPLHRGAGATARLRGPAPPDRRDRPGPRAAPRCSSPTTSRRRRAS